MEFVFLCLVLRRLTSFSSCERSCNAIVDVVAESCGWTRASCTKTIAQAQACPAGNKEGRWQRAEGAEQRAESREQTAEIRKQREEGEREKT